MAATPPAPPAFSTRAPARPAAKPVSPSMVPLHVVIVGHVDHGKSTLVGRLLHETGSLPDGKVEAVAEMCRKRGMPFEWAFVTDALKAERDQGITIDVSHIRFRTALRPYVLVDAPGHREFLRNMISGSAASDGALLVIDAAEGVRDQSRRHAFLLHLLGMSQVVVVVNKMDLAEDPEARFAEIEREFRRYLSGIGIAPLAVVPASARTGANIAARDPAMAWYSGPTVAEALDRMAASAPPRDLPLRLPIQDVFKFDARRILAGRIESGRLHVGDTLLFSPSNKIAKIRALESWNTPAPLFTAAAGQSVGITLDEQIFVERGEVASHVENPPVETSVFRARLFWLGKAPLAEGKSYTLKLGTATTPVTVERVERIIDTADLSTRAGGAIERDEVGEVVLRVRGLLALDPFAANKRTGRFVLVDGYDLVGGGIVSMDGYADQRALVTVKSTNVEAVTHRVTAEMRAGRAGHAGGVLWFTGLSGAGKSTLAIELEQRLFAKGYQVYVLDGDNVRRGLNANLGFSPEDRAENIRRVGEVAALFADAGVIVISALISPYRSDRDRARHAAGERFHEVYIKAGLETCERRDPKGLYKRARLGEIRDFTGVSAPYEPPSAPELVIDTEALAVEDAMARLVDYVETHFVLKRS